MQAICFDDQASPQVRLLNRDVNPVTHTGGLGWSDSVQEWFTGCMSRPTSDGKRRYFIQDLTPEVGDFSVEFPLGTDPIFEVSLDRSTEVCAVRDANQVRVYRRQAWKDLTGARTLEQLALLAGDGRFAQLELAAETLRSQTRLRNSFGEEVYAMLAAAVGDRWADVELAEKQRIASVKSGEGNGVYEDRSSVLTSLEEWWSQGSEFAILASAFRHLEIGRRARGDGNLSSVSQTSKDEFLKRNRKVAQEIRPLFNRKVKSLGALRLAILSGLNTGKVPEELQPLTKQQFENFPHSTLSHVDICIRMLPRFGGLIGEGGEYLAAVAALLPKPEADHLYTRVAIGFGQMNQPKVQVYQPEMLPPEESGISIGRILRSIDSLLQRNELAPHEVEFLIKLAHSVSRVDLVEKLAKHHVGHFGMAHVEKNNEVAKLLNNARMEMAK